MTSSIPEAQAMLPVLLSVLLRALSFSFALTAFSMRTFTLSAKLAIAAVFSLFLFPLLAGTAGSGASATDSLALLLSSTAPGGVVFPWEQAIIDIAAGGAIGVLSSLVFILAAISARWIRRINRPLRLSASPDVLALLLGATAALMFLSSGVLTDVVYALGRTLLAGVEPKAGNLLIAFNEYKEAIIELFISVGKSSLLLAAWLLLPLFFLSLVFDFFSLGYRRYFPQAYSEQFVDAGRGLIVVAYLVFQFHAIEAGFSRTLTKTMYEEPLSDLVLYLFEP